MGPRHTCLLPRAPRAIFGNGCLGVGVMMLLALTLERYVSVCHPGHARPILGSPRRAVMLIPTATFLAYLPAAFRSQVSIGSVI